MSAPTRPKSSSECIARRKHKAAHSIDSLYPIEKAASEVVTTHVDRSHESKTPKDGFEYPSPIRHAEIKYGHSPIASLCHRLQDTTIPEKSKETIKQILDSYKCSMKFVQDVPSGVRPQSLSRKASFSALSNERMPRQQSRNLSVSAASIPSPSLKEKLPPQTTTGFNSPNSTGTRYSSPVDSADDQCGSQLHDRKVSSRAGSLGNSLTSGVSRPSSAAEKAICIPAGWSPSSLAYSAVEESSNISISAGHHRDRHMQIRRHMVKSLILAEKDARESTDRLREQKSLEERQKQEEVAVSNHLKYMENLEQAKRQERRERREQKRLLLEKKREARRVAEESEDEARRKHIEVTQTILAQTQRDLENEVEKHQRELFHQKHERIINEKKDRLIEKEEEERQKALIARQKRLEDILRKAQTERDKIEAARERKKHVDALSQKTSDFAERLQQAENNRSKANKHRDKRQKYLDTLIQEKNDFVQKRHEKIIEAKRQLLSLREKAAEENVLLAKQALADKYQKLAEENIARLHEAKIRKEAQVRNPLALKSSTI
eukprot:TRINITY_DN4421_c0_g1_i6.p1 TRINITY_DN4421_c0_g1~~TRINITY_DN4421_c0_g1_i6.p1  ORF type:complete len:549 (-),score=117.85 TRINITY_DN4421_c0_g1_i6:85-1731(-)